MYFVIWCGHGCFCSASDAEGPIKHMRLGYPSPDHLRTMSRVAWTLPPAQPIAAPTVPSSTTTVSFADIQRMQELLTTSTSKDRRSLRDIQEEKARQQESDFLKWWAKEEELVRLEMSEQE
ncbi:hypothetical protein OG21DRAFT_1606591 [Imleria badia]|nr:hypothetical protein OG21DRAFT_1606591 [Imleria badia]